MRTLSLVALLAAAVRGQGATIRAIGVLGNSGKAGEHLIRVGQFPYDRARSGVALDGDSTLWLSGGDRINRIGLDGRLVESFALEPKGATVDSRTFAVLDGTLYFFARRAPGTVELFALPMRTGAIAKALPLALPPRKRDHMLDCLAPQPLDGRLLIAAEPKDATGDEIAVYRVDPRACAIERALTVKGSYPHGLAVDPTRRVIYIGANFGLFVGGTTHQSVYAITAVRPDGTPVSDAFPVQCPKTPATPTQFRGVISLAGGALWDTAWYGFLARLDLAGRGDPGRIVQWHHELHYPTQILGLRDGAPTGLVPLAIATPMPDAVYFAVWDNGERRLRLARRLGALPVLASLGLSAGGWVTAGTARAQLWWRWEATADAAPHKAQLHVAVTPLHFHGDEAFAIAAQYQLSDRRKQPLMPTVFSPRPGDRNEGQRVGDAPPMKEPVGLAVAVDPGKQQGTVFVTDAVTRQVWRRDILLPSLRPAGKDWAPIVLHGVALKAPTDIAALTGGRVLLADEGRILLLDPAAGGYRAAWTLDRWGDGPAERFGPRLRLAVDGASMLVCDTARHRVVWLDWTRRTFLGQMGHTDVAGDDAEHVASPTLVALRGTRAVVADQGNQRILKVMLR